MAYTIQLFDSSEYEQVCEWWAGHNWVAPEKDHLSSFGMVCCYNGRGMAAGWLYLTTSKYCLIEFLVTDPKAPIKARTKALKLLLERLIAEAKILCPGGTVFSSIKSKGLIKLYQKAGFVVGDENMTNLVTRCV